MRLVILVRIRIVSLILLNVSHDRFLRTNSLVTRIFSGSPELFFSLIEPTMYHRRTFLVGSTAERKKFASIFVSLRLPSFRHSFPYSILFANRDPLLHCAILTLYEAAPVKLAFAPVCSPLSYHVVAPAAAQIGASIPAGAGLVASATSGAADVERRVLLAKVRRFLVEEELFREILDPLLAAATLLLFLFLLLFPT